MDFIVGISERRYELLVAFWYVPAAVDNDDSGYGGGHS